MKRIIIIGEGPTEQSFCNDVLQPYFNSLNIYIQNPTIKKTSGGIVNWDALKYQIQQHLSEDSKSIVTTLIDYYGINEHHKYPNWKEAQKLKDKIKRMELIEAGMKNDIDNLKNHRFIPYLQLHEFEGLLFNNIDVFNNQIPDEDFINKEELIRTIKNNPNPELINDSPNNAPSYRLRRLIKGYNKIVYGAILAQEIGLNRIRIKSVRFNEWITKLEQI